MGIILSELLNFFNLTIELPAHIYDIDINSIFKEARLVVEKDSYVFTKDNAVLTITPDNPNQLITIIFYTQRENGRNTKVVYSEDYVTRS
ncbi:hypothetical protein [Methanobrevibacter sp.]|uniref:hypothetical protein n=1 Tax=Methanobrevibacter sp. TaxID=66852 RepID=UPI00386FA418